MTQIGTTRTDVERERSTAQAGSNASCVDGTVWGLLGLALLLRLAYTWKSLNLDELATLEYSGQPVLGMFEYIARHDTHPPLYYLLVHFWRYAGSGEVWVRLPGVLLGAGMCYLTYLIARQMTDRRCALIALFLAATAPTLIWVSQEARNYALMGFFTGVSTYCLVKILRDPKPKYWIGYSLAAAAGLYSFYYGAYVIVAQNVAFVMGLPRGWRTYRNWMLAQLGIIALFAPWVPTFLKQADAVGSDYTSRFEMSVRLLVLKWDDMLMSIEPFSISKLLLNLGDQGWFHWFVVLFTIVTALAAITALVRRRRSSGDWGIRYYWPYAVLLTIIVTVILESLVLYAVRNVFISERYFTFLSMFGCILGAMLISRLQSRAGFAILALVLILQMPALVKVYAPAEDWRGVANFLEENVRADSFVGTVSYHSARCVRHYVSGDVSVHGLPYDIPGVNRRMGDLMFVQGIEPEDMPAIGAELGKYDDIWMVWSHTRRGIVDRGVGPMMDWFGTNGYRAVRTVRYPGITLEHFVRSG